MLKGGCCGLLRTRPQPCGAACPRQAGDPLAKITTVSLAMTFFRSTSQLSASPHIIHLHDFTTVRAAFFTFGSNPEAQIGKLCLPSTIITTVSSGPLFYGSNFSAIELFLLQFVLKRTTFLRIFAFFRSNILGTILNKEKRTSLISFSPSIFPCFLLLIFHFPSALQYTHNVGNYQTDGQHVF